MSEQYDFLNLRLKPAILGFRESSYLTGLHVDSLVHLEKIGEFKALGKPPKGAQRWFATKYVLGLCDDEKWLSKAVKLIREHNKGRNSAKLEAEPGEGDDHE